MAVYHCSVKMVGRNAGRSSVAAAAYRAGEKLVNQYDGIEHDFTRKNWVEYKEIMLPENAPEAYRDRETLWNAVELAEKSKNSQLAREFEIALPVEMTRKQQIEIVQQFVGNELVSKGMCADIAIHNPPVVNDRHQPIDKMGNVTKDVSKMQFRNPHAHILCTVRSIDKSGEWEKKSQTEYLCKRAGEERAFTADEFKKAKEEGWEKQYRYYENGKKVYYTALEGEEKELERVNRSPKTTPFGRKNETVEYWNAKERIFEWRKDWEDVVNQKFREMHSDIRIDSRSFKEQGRVDEVPTLHMGTSATNMERRAERELSEGKAEVERSDIGNINRQIKAHNAFVRAIKAKLEAITGMARDFIAAAAKRLESRRAEIIGNTYQESVLSEQRNQLENELLPEKERLIRFKTEEERVQQADRESAERILWYQQEIKKCLPHQFVMRRNMEKQIQEEQKRIEQRNEYLSGVSKMCGYVSQEDYFAAKKVYNKRLAVCEKLGSTLEAIRQTISQAVSEYGRNMENVDAGDMEELRRLQQESRQQIEGEVKGSLQKKYGDSFDKKIYENAKKTADRLLDKENKKHIRATKKEENERKNKQYKRCH